ncbi:hypothetical protein RYX36_033157 [Vicia faba]
MVALRERASFVKDSLHRSQTITDNMVSILVSFDHRLSSLETAMCPTQIKMHSIRSSHDNIDKTLKAAEQQKEFKSSGGIISHANSLLAKAMLKLEDEFKHLLTNYSKPVEPDRLFDCLPNSLRPLAYGQQSSGGGKRHSDKPSIETVTFTLPTLIPPRVITLLHELAQ